MRAAQSRESRPRPSLRPNGALSGLGVAETGDWAGHPGARWGKRDPSCSVSRPITQRSPACGESRRIDSPLLIPWSGVGEPECQSAQAAPKGLGVTGPSAGGLSTACPGRSRDLESTRRASRSWAGRARPRNDRISSPIMGRRRIHGGSGAIEGEKALNSRAAVQYPLTRESPLHCVKSWGRDASAQCLSQIRRRVE